MYPVFPLHMELSENFAEIPMQTLLQDLPWFWSRPLGYQLYPWNAPSFLATPGPTQGHQTRSSKLGRWVPAEVQSHSVLRKMTNQIWNWDFLKFTRILIELGNRRRENRVWWQSSFYTSLSFNNDHIFIMTFFIMKNIPIQIKKKYCQFPLRWSLQLLTY